MKLPLAPLVSLLFGASYLVANTIAYSYNDYNELDARYQIDDVLSERGFGLEARETIDVPFQPSLRAFLEEAVTAHRRSMSENEEYLEARNNLINVCARVAGELIDLKVDPGHTTGAEFKKRVVETGRVPKGMDVTAFTLRLNELYGKKLDESMSLEHSGVKEGSKIFFREMITLHVIAKVGKETVGTVPQIKVADDLTPSAFRKLVEKAGGFTIGPAEMRVEGRPNALDPRKTLHAEGVKNGAKIELSRERPLGASRR
ncbi:hypothetical protein DFP72DRAFT_879503 [Ephemerocybe angulata]|uniref:Ubiquitin-like domain-containing protein n=1 Tax=Ephemerocybe angulata TaxID=980116 RepID=A0A8H6IC31_9AGAR|nr:hypothetical protein DFP72DRAFT_879503 [Tulosesus angulatus]